MSTHFSPIQVQVKDNDQSSCFEKQTAWIFAGQGSQVLGMGKDLSTLPYAQFRFNQAQRILGWSVLEICDRQSKLLQTKYCQPALFVISSILADLLKREGMYPDCVAGYSLGEYIALYIAGVFDFETGLELLKQRAEIMEQAPPGKMVAVMGCDRTTLEQLVSSTPDADLTNDDLSQFILSGTDDAVTAIISQIEAKKTIPLNVSKPFHTHLMDSAELAYQSVLNSVPFHVAQIPVLSNLDPVPAVNPLLLKNRLRQHMTNKIRWREISLYLEQKGIEQIIEISPTRVLTPKLKRINQRFDLKNITNLTDVKCVRESITI